MQQRWDTNDVVGILNLLRRKIVRIHTTLLNDVVILITIAGSSEAFKNIFLYRERFVERIVRGKRLRLIADSNVRQIMRSVCEKIERSLGVNIELTKRQRSLGHLRDHCGIGNFA